MSKIEDRPEKVIETSVPKESPLDLDFELEDDEGQHYSERPRSVPNIGAEEAYVAQKPRSDAPSMGGDGSPGQALQIRTSSPGDIAKMVYDRCLTAAELDEKRIIHPDMKSRETFNTFRELRTKMLKLSQGDNFVVMISSVVPQGGSSFFARNLAAAFAFDESKTSLLIDCNFQSESQREVFEIESEMGLRDYLAEGDAENGGVELEDIIYDSGIERLRLCPAGRNREVFKEFFTTKRMAEFIELVRRRYTDRFIFIDAPAMDDTDAQILAQKSDYVLLIVPYGKASETQITDAVETAGEDKVAGVILNNIP